MIAGLLRRISLGLIVFVSFSAGEIQARGIYPHGTPLLLLAVAALLAGANVVANTLTRAERSELRGARRRVHRIEADLTRAKTDVELWKGRCFTHVEGRALDRAEIRGLRVLLHQLRSIEGATR